MIMDELLPLLTLGGKMKECQVYLYGGDNFWFSTNENIYYFKNLMENPQITIESYTNDNGYTTEYLINWKFVTGFKLEEPND